MIMMICYFNKKKIIKTYNTKPKSTINTQFFKTNYVKLRIDDDDDDDDDYDY